MLHNISMLLLRRLSTQSLRLRLLKNIGVAIKTWSTWAIPPVCIHCDELVDPLLPFALCENCQTVDWTMARCQRCGHRCHNSERSQKRCHYCKKISLPFQHMSSIGPYQLWLRKAILNVKYHQDALSLRYLQHLTLQWPCPSEGAVLSYVPSHPKRLRQRGAKTQHLPEILRNYLHENRVSLSKLLRKKSFSVAQVELNGEERRIAAQGTFAYCGPEPAPEQVWLFDDVSTTGSTLLAACETLRESGVKNIRIFVLASPAWE